MNKEHDEDMKRYQEVQSRINALKEQYNGVNRGVEKINAEIHDQR